MPTTAAKKIDYLTPQRLLREHDYKMLHEGDPRPFKDRMEEAKQAKPNQKKKQTTFLTHMRDDPNLNLLKREKEPMTNEEKQLWNKRKNVQTDLDGTADHEKVKHQ